MRTATLRLLPTGGSVLIEETYATGVENLWEACTTPERLLRWIARVEGELRPGGEFRASFHNGWDGVGRVEVCEAPHRLVVSTWTDADARDATTIEAVFTPHQAHTTLRLEERGIAVDELPAHGAGWQIQLEALAAHLEGRRPDNARARWDALIPHYEAAEILDLTDRS